MAYCAAISTLPINGHVVQADDTVELAVTGEVLEHGLGTPGIRPAGIVESNVPPGTTCDAKPSRSASTSS